MQGLILTPFFQPQVSMSLPKRKILFSVLIAAAIAAVLGIFVAFGPPGLYAKSESPEFCGSCHAVQPEYEAWFHAGAHRRIKCVDCHLPNDNFAQHLTWKTLDGLKDFTAFHMGRVPDNMQISDHGAKVVLANCQRCHAETDFTDYMKTGGAGIATAVCRTNGLARLRPGPLKLEGRDSL